MSARVASRRDIDRIPAEERARLLVARERLDAADPEAYAEMCGEGGDPYWALARPGESRGKVISRVANEWGCHFTEVRLRVEWKTWEPWPPFEALLEERLDAALYDVLYPTWRERGAPVEREDVTDEQIAEAWAGAPKTILDCLLAGHVFAHWDESGMGCPWEPVKRGAPGARKWWRADV